MDLIELTYFEIDIKFCGLRYGVGACTAALGVTGTQKCFNTRNFSHDCQDPLNYLEEGLTVRFGIDNGYLPENIPCIPSLVSCDVQNAEVQPGVSIGQRSTCTAVFKNHRHGDAGFDPYISDRTYNPFEQGTFWGKFRARNSYMENQPCRRLKGYLGQDLSEFVVEHFVVDKFTGPDADGRVSIKAVDFMRLVSGKNAQAPIVSQGYLSADYPVGTTSITLEPSWVGDTYPTAGTLSIGQELLEFTRTGDVISGFTTTADHEQGDVAQIALIYDGQTTAGIIYDLIVNYTPLDASYTDLSAWQEIAANYSDTLYSATIVKPTAVETLLNELVEQAGLILFGDTVTQKIRFDVLRPSSDTGVGPNESRILADSFAQADQPDRRYSQVWVFYNQRDVFKNLDEPTNFYSVYADSPGANLYATESIKQIFSRWIPRGAQGVAADVAGRALARFVNPPRKFSFSLFATDPFKPTLGQTVPLTAPPIETAFGTQAVVSAVITGVQREGEGNIYEAEELNFDTSLVDIGRTITIDYDSYNLNLRELYDDIYSEISGSTPIRFVVSQGVVVGSVSTGLYAIESGDWPSGVEPSLILEPGAYVVGKGGEGGFSTYAAGQAGGPAIRVTSPIAVTNDGVIGGGGGGGAGASFIGGIGGGMTYGGGGAGRSPGFSSSSPGTLETGGTVSIAGDGGDLGQPGTSGTDPNWISTGSGGPPGPAVNGESLVTWINEGDIRGPRIG